MNFPLSLFQGLRNVYSHLHNSESIEEERRFAYVGITRGKDKVILLSTYKRTLLGEDWYHNPSKFTKEIKDSINVFLTEKADHMGRAIRFKLENENINFDVIQSQKPKRNTIQATQATFDIFNVGDVISHATLGTGIIEKTSGTGDSLMYDISFHSGKKKLMAKFAKLQRQ